MIFNQSSRICNVRASDIDEYQWYEIKLGIFRTKDPLCVSGMICTLILNIATGYDPPSFSPIKISFRIVQYQYYVLASSLSISHFLS